MITTIKSNHAIQKRIDMDLLDRSKVGILIYAVILPIIFYFYQFYEQQPNISWALTLLMASFSIIRLLHALFTEKLYQYSTTLWLGIFALFSMLQATILGGLFGATIANDNFEPIVSVIFLATGGMAGGALTALMPRLWIALLNLSLLLIPGALLAILSNQMGYAILITIYYLYMFTIGIRSNREYLRSFHIEFQLEEQRKELEQLNKIDPLTHIYNRGHFNTAYEHQWNNGIRNQHHQSLLLIDIDKFKKINDNYGHLFGDECLIFIAKTIHETAQRKTDIIARFGGEEFAILLSDTSLEEATLIAESIRSKIANQPFILNNTELTITVSIGVAGIIPKSSVNPNQLIEEADTYLYQAKDLGRNQVASQLSAKEV